MYINDVSETEKCDSRSSLDVWECAIACTGFLVAATGVTISSVATTLFGVAFLALGLIYFYVTPDAED